MKWSYSPLGGTCALVNPVHMCISYIFASGRREHERLDALHWKPQWTNGLCRWEQTFHVSTSFEASGFQNGLRAASAPVQQDCLFRQPLVRKTFVETFAKQLCFYFEGEQTFFTHFLNVEKIKMLCHWMNESFTVLACQSDKIAQI